MIADRVDLLKARAELTAARRGRDVAERQLKHVMQLLRYTHMDHGTCEPREQRACTHCNAVDELNRLLIAETCPDYSPPETELKPSISLK